MTPERERALRDNVASKLTDEEIAEGYHFCYEYDGLLIGPGSDELNECSCLPKDHKVYLTKPAQPNWSGVFGEGIL